MQVTFSTADADSDGYQHVIAEVLRPETEAVDLDALPPEMLSHVLSFLTLSEQLKLATVSRRWRQAVDDCLARHRHFSDSLIPGMGRVTDQMLESILFRLPGLHSLVIRGFDLDVDIVARHCPQLVKANLYNFVADVPSLERLCHSCPKLAELTLPSALDDACIETVVRGLPELRSLDIDISKLTGRFLAVLPASLERLELRGRGNLSCSAPDRAPRCTALKQLDISGMRWSPPDGLPKLLSLCPRLDRLIANGSNITDVFIEQLVEKSPSIRYLYLDGCVDVTADGLKNLGRLKELRKLNLLETYTNDAVLERLQGAFHLTELAVGTYPFNRSDFSEEALARLVVSCPSLRLLVPTEMVDVGSLVGYLVGQLSPDRDVTVVAHDGFLDEMDEPLPEDGPLRLVPEADDELFIAGP